MDPIILYQHTPLIHFQGSQPGATLRGSDVKPRLDRWIIMQYGAKAMKTANEADPDVQWTERERYLAGWEKLQREHPTWVAMSDPREDRQRSLNYRIQITPGVAHPLNQTPVDYANYFADVGQEEGEQAPLVSFYHTIDLAVHAADEALIARIEEEAEDFFYTTNFGTRATKGFGSFSMAKPAKGWVFKFRVDHPEPEDETYPLPLKSKGGEQDLYQRLFRHIEFFHRSLRTGLNCFTEPHQKKWNRRKEEFALVYNDRFYMKPLIFQYAMDEGITWEKKIIKSMPSAYFGGDSQGPRSGPIREYFPDDGFSPEEERSEDAWPHWYNGQNASSEPGAVTKALIRDALGLSSEQSWKDWSFNKVKKTSAEKGENAISRAPSPFTFVPVRERDAFAIYVYARQPEDLYLNHHYDVKAASTKQLSVFPDFDMSIFLDDYLSVPNLERSVVIKNKNRDDRDKDPLFQKLKLMYAQARGSLNLDNIAQP